jgi:phosphoribosylformylglycinamidine synthase
VDAVVEAIRAGASASAHDCSEGGLAVALAECCMMTREAAHGATVDLSAWAHLSPRALLFAETQGRVIVSTPDPAAVLAIARRHGVPARIIGTVGTPGAAFEIRIGARSWRTPVDTLAAAYHDAIPSMMARVAAASDDMERPITAGV